MQFKFFESDIYKCCRSEKYNTNFDKRTGEFERWGKTEAEDPLLAPFPEIVDCEISTVCNGLGTPCKFCYKSNTSKGINMSFETFKNIFHKLPRSVQQIAFGIGDLAGNPDLWKIMEYCRTNEYNKVVPNITINGYNLTDEFAQNLVKYCGAVAVSRYTPSDYCYNAIEKLTSLGLKQVNIHQLLSLETLQDCYQIIEDHKTDSRLKNLNAIVLLSLKPKGRGSLYHPVEKREDIEKFINHALSVKAPIGFDSCFAPIFLEIIKNHPECKEYSELAEPCESTCFSCYFDATGTYYPCSFCEDEQNIASIDMLKVEDFTKEVWFNPGVNEFRKKLLTNNRKCPVFDIYKSIL